MFTSAERGIHDLNTLQVAEASDHSATATTQDILNAPRKDVHRARRLYIRLISSAAIAMLSITHQAPHVDSGSSYYEPVQAQESRFRATACFKPSSKESVSTAAAVYKADVQSEEESHNFTSIQFDEYEPTKVPCISATVNDHGYAELQNNPLTTALARDQRVEPAHHATETRGGNMLIRTGADEAHHHGFDGTDVTVALIDSGVNFDESGYPSYKDALLEQSACIGINYSPLNLSSGCVGGADRVIENRAGTYCLDGSGDCSHGHKIGQATHIAAPDANILSIAQHTDETVDGKAVPAFFLSEAVRGIDIALEMNADAILYSMAMPNSNDVVCEDYYTPLNVAIQSAHAADVPIFVSTGNYGSVEYPACLHRYEEGLHAITSNDFSGTIPYHAGTEPGVLSAMGQGFSVRTVSGVESTTSGTSYGAAVAAGLYADVAEALPDYSSDEVMTLFHEHSRVAHAHDGSVVQEMDVEGILRSPTIAQKLKTYFSLFLPFAISR